MWDPEPSIASQVQTEISYQLNQADFRKMLPVLYLYRPYLIPEKKLKNGHHLQCCGSGPFWTGSGSDLLTSDRILIRIRIRILLIT